LGGKKPKQKQFKEYRYDEVVVFNFQQALPSFVIEFQSNLILPDPAATGKPGVLPPKDDPLSEREDAVKDVKTD
jgi:hypothetical protein